MTAPSFGLRTRLTLFVLAMGTVVAAFVVAGLPAVLDRQLNAAVDTELRARASEVATELAAGGSEPLGDPFAQALDRSGTVTARSATAPEKSLLKDGQLEQALARPLIFEASVPALRGMSRFYAVPVKSGVVIVGSPLAEAGEAASRLETVLSIVVVVVVLCAGAVTWLVVGGSLRPVGRMVVAADNISGHADDARLPVPRGRDEIAGLATTLNLLLDRLAASFARESAFVDDASHELRTPLTVLRGELELALDDPDPAGVDRSIRVALDEAGRLSALADDLLILARERSGGLGLDRRATDLVPWATAVVARLRPAIDVPVEVRGDDVSARIDRGQLERVLVNLITNAETAGARRVQVDFAEGAGGHVRLQVADDGPGFPPELLPRVFDRFSRGDSARQRGRTGGAGLGLALVAAIVRAHEGSATASNDSPLGGGLVSIELPGTLG